MSEKNSLFISFSLILSISLAACAMTALLISRRDETAAFRLLNGICAQVLELEPEAAPVLQKALKEYHSPAGRGDQSDILTQWGYRPADFAAVSSRSNLRFAAGGFLAALLLFTFVCQRRRQKQTRRIKALTDYLEQTNAGNAPLLSVSGEDDFSRLEDAIYKTVTSLHQTKDAAIQAKNRFAENLSNIAHQIRTPITAISLSLQMAAPTFDKNLPSKIQKQLLRLTRLQEALLVLSRLDAGVLLLQKDEIDVFTVLVLAADHLQETALRLGSTIDIPERGEMAITADLDWTMEALINLMKNCLEHSGGSCVRCFYEQNPLYTEIYIEDQGSGFAETDIPHLFERFYRGQNAGEGGIGIGLALAKEIIERQNGTLRARNVPGGGALFEIRFYRH